MIYYKGTGDLTIQHNTFEVHCNSQSQLDYFIKHNLNEDERKSFHLKPFLYTGILDITPLPYTYELLVRECTNFYILVIRKSECYLIVPKTLLGVWMYKHYVKSLFNFEIKVDTSF